MDHHQEEAVPEGVFLAPLNVEVQEVPDNPESPSPALCDDGEIFKIIYDRAELMLLEDWMEHTRFMRGGLGYIIVELLITERFKVFLQFLHGPQWEDKILRGDEMPLGQLDAYVSGYSLLRGCQRSQWDRLFPAWTSAELRSHLVKLDEAGGFIEVE